MVAGRCVTKKLWREIIRGVPTYKPGKPIEEVRREHALDDVIKLASNENAVSPPPQVIEAIMAAAKNLNRYPDGGCFYLRRALADKFSLSEDNFICGNGSDEIITMALRASVDPGDEVVIADPTFLIYKISSVIAGATVRQVPSKNFKYDLDRMVEAITPRTKIVFIANPDNPTGTYVTEKELSAFLKKVPENVLVFMDEAYYEFGTGGDYPETLGLIEKKDLNIIITRTFSKAYGLAGLRVGYGIANEDVIASLNKVREPFNVNSLAQAAAVASLADEVYPRASIAMVREGKDKLYKKFDEMGIFYVPSRTNFILVDTKRDARKIFEHLLKKGVIIREMSSWGLDTCVRVNVGLPEENDKFLSVFEEAINEIPVK
ncbi:MAG: histidinol-phosphate transaminase [Candidatus Omnitrophica bacterium]|nr:histidinol-phosphate transaminase [Candidatus Omnitrophota bacterium]